MTPWTLILLLLASSCAPPQITIPIVPLTEFQQRTNEALIKISNVLAQSDLPAAEKAQLIDSFRVSFDEFNGTVSGLVQQYMTITAARAQGRAENIVNVLLQVLGIATTVLVGTRVISDLGPLEHMEIGRHQLVSWESAKMAE